ncbi:MAG: MATE family efflux transporter [Acidobacteriaceae bacterium]|nr:MATE family efflux transporter [Acidobacteriaceae bacterium]
MSAATSTAPTDLSADVRRVIKLAVPVALGELGWMAMTVVDTIMVGSLGPAAIGAIGVGNSAFYTFAIFGMGLLLGLDTLVSQAFGAGNREDCHRSLAQGVYGALFLTVPLMAIFACMPPSFKALGINATVSRLAGSFVTTLSFSTLPLLLYGAFRRYLQGIGHVRPVMFALVSANLINWFFNWLFIQGHWGFPALGVVGSALSTCLARVYMAGTLAFFIWWFERGLRPGFGNLFQKPDWDRLLALGRIGLPAAMQILLEIGAFGSAAVLAGRLNPVALAAHQIALNCAAVSYMVPLGISSAAAVAVGHAIGRGYPDAARRSGFIAVVLACAFMMCSAVAFLTIPRQILRVYTTDVQVLQIGVGLLAIGAWFQLFDGIQTVATGALRGLGDTRIPMFVNLAGYWFFGLPIGYVLCFHYGRGVYGLWWGLTLALIAISLVLLVSWQRKASQLRLTPYMKQAARD